MSAAGNAAPADGAPAVIGLTVNGQAHSLRVDPRWPLLDVLRETLQLRGSRFGCGAGAAGAHAPADR